MISLNTTFGSLMCSGTCFQPLWWWSREWNFKDSWGINMLLKPYILICLMPTLSQTNSIQKVIFKSPNHCNCPVAWLIFTDIPKHTHGPFWSSIFSCWIFPTRKFRYLVWFFFFLCQSLLSCHDFVVMEKKIKVQKIITSKTTIVRCSIPWIINREKIKDRKS